MSSLASISLDTRILDLPNQDIPRFGPISARKLALGLTAVTPGKDINNVTVEDLLQYLQMRHEDRSSMVEIRHLYHGLEASLDLTVRVAGGYPVRNRRSYKQQLYIFKIGASDQKRTGPQVIIWWFISGPRAQQIIEYNTKRFIPGTRFIAFGKWERDKHESYPPRLTHPHEPEPPPAPHQA